MPFRHPSQLYEGVGEGLLLGLVLGAVWLLTRRRPLGPGKYTAIFLLGYALVRGSLEFVRQPDDFLQDQGLILGMTRGQTLSVGMVVGALLVLFLPRRRATPSA